MDKMNMFWKKFIVFFIVFIGTCGVFWVDVSCAQDFDVDKQLGLSISPRSGDWCTVTFFGSEGKINIKEIENAWDKIQETVENMQIFK